MISIIWTIWMIIAALRNRVSCGMGFIAGYFFTGMIDSILLFIYCYINGCGGL